LKTIFLIHRVITTHNPLSPSQQLVAHTSLVALWVKKVGGVEVAIFSTYTANFRQKR